jgi:DNA adenine methylase
MNVSRQNPEKSLAGSILESYPGSKGSAGVAERIIRQMPPHRVYIDGFAGGAAVYRKKKPAEMNVLVDADPQVIEALRGYIGEGADVEYVLASFLDWMESYRWTISRHTLVYLDPPYLRSVRTRLLYDVEFASEPEHVKLLELARALPCWVMLSGYASPLYRRMLRDWRTLEIPSMTHGGQRTETVWMNYPEPELLHDERFAGAGYRERENISRKKKRWAKKFAAMPRSERQAVAAALAGCDRGAVEAALLQGKR